MMRLANFLEYHPRLLLHLLFYPYALLLILGDALYRIFLLVSLPIRAIKMIWG